MLGVSSNLSILTLSANGLYSQLKAIGLLTRLLKRKKIYSPYNNSLQRQRYTDNENKGPEKDTSSEWKPQMRIPVLIPHETDLNPNLTGKDIKDIIS